MNMCVSKNQLVNWVALLQFNLHLVQRVWWWWTKIGAEWK